MSANIQLVNSMFKLSPISASAEFQPFEEPKPEVPPVELVTELVKVELQELRLYVVVCVKNASFSVADGDMHPRQDLAHFLLVIHDNSLMGSHNLVLFKGGVCVGSVRGSVHLPVCSLFYLWRFGGEEAFVYLHITMKIITCVTLAHHVTEFVHHFPYGLVTLAPQLTLDFLSGYGSFGRW